VYSFHY